MPPPGLLPAPPSQILVLLFPPLLLRLLGGPPPGAAAEGRPRGAALGGGKRLPARLRRLVLRLLLRLAAIVVVLLDLLIGAPTRAFLGRRTTEADGGLAPIRSPVRDGVPRRKGQGSDAQCGGGRGAGTGALWGQLLALELGRCSREARATGVGGATRRGGEGPPCRWPSTESLAVVRRVFAAQNRQQLHQRRRGVAQRAVAARREHPVSAPRRRHRLGGRAAHRGARPVRRHRRGPALPQLEPGSAEKSRSFRRTDSD
mmetsp:Transcript_123844/g.396439  ORF Transcript_123844/g.396439 Transcript_123844/m.396439 type:complete len:259 (+) Transcript_123844:2084-2860(+)